MFNHDTKTIVNEFTILHVGLSGKINLQVYKFHNVLINIIIM